MSWWPFWPLSTKHYMKCHFPLQHCWIVQPWEIRLVLYGDLDGWNGVGLGVGARHAKDAGDICIHIADS